MHKVINAGLDGQAKPFRLHEDAYDALGLYLDRARSRLVGDPDQAEVLGDLERSIGAKLADRLGAGDRILTAGDVASVLDEVGPVGADEDQPELVENPLRRRRLNRIRDGQQIAGVCSGVAAYSEIRVDWVRTAFVLLALATGGLFVLVYLAMAFLLPIVPTRTAWIAETKLDRAYATRR